jgi:hypothetical protein
LYGCSGGKDNMIITYSDELGIVSVNIDKAYGITFNNNIAYFTDEDGNDYKINTEHLINIIAE